MKTGCEGTTTRRAFLEDLACKIAGVGLVSVMVPESGAFSQDKKQEVLANVKVSEHRDLERIGGYVLVKDTTQGDVLIVRSGPEEFSALSNVCPHKQCLVEVKSPELIRCPCHQSAYKIDGTYISGPAKASLRKFEVRVEGDSLVVTGD